MAAAVAAVGLEVSVRCPLVAISRAVIVRASFVVPIARDTFIYNKIWHLPSDVSEAYRAPLFSKIEGQ